MASKPFPSGHDLTSADVNDLVGVYARDIGGTAVVNTVAETTAYTKTIGANHMSTNRVLRGTVIADCLQNSGGTGSLTVRVRLNGTLCADQTLTAIPNSAGRFDVTFLFEIAMANATNNQYTVGGFKYLPAGTLAVSPSFRLPAVDMTVARDLTVTAQMDVAHASFEYRPVYVLLELA